MASTGFSSLYHFACCLIYNIIVIKISEYSPRFTHLIGPGKRDTVATLATLALLSYAKLLSTTIAVLSFAVLDYPDGSQETVWHSDGNVKYFHGKHIVLAITALLIVLIGIPYTFLLFSWQWLIQLSSDKLYNWTKNTKLNATYHTPYNNKHRYWTGLLLLVRVVLYITAAVTESSSPQIPVLMTILLIGSLLFLKGIIGIRLYKRSSVDIVETLMLLNLLVFAAFTQYNFKTDNTKQMAIAYVSTIITLLILVGVVIYHTSLLINRQRTAVQLELMPVVHYVVDPPQNEVTYSIVEIPKGESPLDVPDSDHSDVISDNEGGHNETLPHENDDNEVDSKNVNDTLPLLEN